MLLYSGIVRGRGPLDPAGFSTTIVLTLEVREHVLAVAPSSLGVGIQRRASYRTRQQCFPGSLAKGGRGGPEFTASDSGAFEVALLQQG